jgi:hypothetical protein
VLEIRLLLPGDDRDAFVCGDEALDRYFRLYAGQNRFRHRIGVNYVAITDGRVIGYASVSPAHIEVERALWGECARIARGNREGCESAGQIVIDVQHSRGQERQRAFRAAANPLRERFMCRISMLRSLCYMGRNWLVSQLLQHGLCGPR